MTTPGTSTLALDLGTRTGFAFCAPDGHIISGSWNFKPGRFEGGGMRFLRFRNMLDEFAGSRAQLGQVAFEEVRRHAGTDAAHIYGGLMGTLTAWCEHNLIPYGGIPIGTWKRSLGLKGNCGKPEVMLRIGDLGYDPKSQDEADAIGVLLHVIGGAR